MTVSEENKYRANLKVLQRHNKFIINIFDQFSHVCVYHHNGTKWEKQGFEGTMFLYERDTYPPYGFYILNRMGAVDFYQEIYPEDTIGAHGSYLMLQNYPDFTKARLAEVQQANPTTESDDRFADKWRVDLNIPRESKGRSQTLGLWMFATDAREPMIDVMIRCVAHFLLACLYLLASVY